MMSIYERISELTGKGKSVYVVTVAAKTGHAPSEPGSKMVILENGDFFGTIGGGALEDLAYKKALGFFKKPESTQRHSPKGKKGSFSTCQAQTAFEPL